MPGLAPGGVATMGIQTFGTFCMQILNFRYANKDFSKHHLLWQLLQFLRCFEQVTWKVKFTCLSCLSSTMIIILTMMTKTILSLMIIITMMTLVTTTQRKQRGNVRTAKENSVEILK